jgi:hypothetical protein
VSIGISGFRYLKARITLRKKKISETKYIQKKHKITDNNGRKNNLIIDLTRVDITDNNASKNN